MSLKLDSVLKPFDGREPWLFWFEKFSTVADFFGWSDEQKIKYLALYLDRVPSRIYQQMPPEERTMDGIGKKFTEAFMPSPVVAHQMLQSRRLREGEAPEELWYELVELWRQQTRQTSQQMWEGKGAENIEFHSVVPYFLSALPATVTTQLRLVNADLDLATLLSKTRTLLSITITEQLAVVGGMATTMTGGKRTQKQKWGNKKLKCYNCGDEHRRDDCPYPEAVCFTCKHAGHRSADCPKRTRGSKNGLGAGGLASPPPRRH